MSVLQTEGRSLGPYFAAANSGHGFVSYYKEIFEKSEIQRRYIIKGGPGTGKSSFMRQVASFARERGMDTELFCCSSDPDSLDGIILQGTVALIDGTAPHSEEASLPGVRDELIDLGAFWDSEALAASGDAIRRLGKEKQACYQKAYGFLSACFEVDAVTQRLLGGCIRQEKLLRAVNRLCEGIEGGSACSVETRMLDGVGMKGCVHLDSWEAQGEVLYWLEEEYGEASFFLSALCDQAMQKGCAVQVARNPVTPETLCGLLFVQSGQCFLSGNSKQRRMPEGAIRINMKRFWDRDALSSVKRELRANRRLRELLMESACESLLQAGQQHFALEKLYASCMDFQAQDRFTRSFCEKLFLKG